MSTFPPPPPPGESDRDLLIEAADILAQVEQMAESYRMFFPPAARQLLARSQALRSRITQRA